MSEAPEMPSQDDAEIMDHVAMEAIHAVHNRDHASFRNAFHTLVAHTLQGMSDSMETKED